MVTNRVGYLWKGIKPFLTASLLIAFIWGVGSFIETKYNFVETAVRSGSSGEVVRDVQQKLKNWGYYNGLVDGVFGSKTKDAVMLFQRRNGLRVDGVVGNETFKALGLMKYVGSSSSGSGNTGPADSELMLLARAIHAEAEGESYIGKVAVGAVLLNRVNHKDFPNTLSGVVYQGLALESVSNGRFAEYDAAQESIRAAQDAINGWDPTSGCLYFWNPVTSTSAWIWTRTIVVRYGNHVFGI